MVNPVAAPAAVLTVREAAGELRIGINQAYEAVRQGVIPSVRIGKRILVPRVGLDAMLAAKGDGPCR